jgi:hypothetical protein
MTPGAWRKNGLLYELAEPAQPAPDDAAKTAAAENSTPHGEEHP